MGTHFRRVCILAAAVVLFSSVTQAGWIFYSKPAYRGRVIDMDTKEPISGAVVSVVYEKYPIITGPAGGNATVVGVRETITDERGEFRIAPFFSIMGPNASEMPVKLYIYKPGYKRFIDSVGVGGKLLFYDTESFFREDQFNNPTSIRFGFLGEGEKIPARCGIVELPKLNTVDELKKETRGILLKNGMKMLKEVLQDNRNEQWEPYQGRTALISAAREGNEVMVEQLIKAGAEVDYARFNGLNALISASQYGHQYVVKVLLKHGAEVNYATLWGETALMAAAARGYAETVGVLLEAGADPNAVDERGMSAMLKALENPQNKDQDKVFEIVKNLVVHGADVNYGAQGNSALGLGVRDYRVVEFLIDAGIDLGSVYSQMALTRAASSGRIDVVELLIERGVDIHSTPALDRRTAFMHASSTRNNSRMVKLLLDAGSKVNLRDRDGCTALILASAAGDAETVRLLLAAGADVNVQNSRGETAEMSALRHRHFEIVNLLQEAGGLSR
ncbi:MAG: ankyrin repeat domain-containing protein [Desulfomonilia bacterium]|nr:ankyrin repeat domain-containing protein [Desulfomonilia bacterium]